MLAMPLIIFLLVLTIQMHEFEKQVQAWDKEIRQQQEQIEELYDRQDPVEDRHDGCIWMQKSVRYI